MRNTLFFLLGYGFFVCDGLFANWFSDGIHFDQYLITLHLLVIFLVFRSIYGNLKYGVIFSIIFGLLFDIVNSGIIGIYLFILPIVVYAVARTVTFFAKSTYKSVFGAIIAVLLLELFVYLIYSLVGTISMPFFHFLLYRLVPTLLFNSVVILILCLPLSKITNDDKNLFTKNKLSKRLF